MSLGTMLEVTPIRGGRGKVEINLGPNLRTLEDKEQAPQGAIVWRVLTVNDGDKRVVWSPDSFLEIRDAKAMFDECVKAGLVPYVCDEQGRPTGEVMREFDPISGEVVFKEVVFAPAKLAVGG